MKDAKKYNWPTDHIYLDREELRKIYTKEHPMQYELARKFNLKNRDDFFCLPQPYMLAMDQVKLVYEKGTGNYGKGYAEASLEIVHEAPWFWCHFLGDPVMPGSQGLDAFMQLAGIWGACSCEVYGRARALEGSFAFSGPILPDSKRVFYRMDVKRFLKKKRLLYFDGSIAVDDPENRIYQFGEYKLGFFTREELSITQEESKVYYQPDWEVMKHQVLEWIANAENYYNKNNTL